MPYLFNGVHDGELPGTAAERFIWITDDQARYLVAQEWIKQWYRVDYLRDCGYKIPKKEPGNASVYYIAPCGKPLPIQAIEAMTDWQLSERKK